MLELVRFCRGSFSYYSGMLLLSPVLVSMKLGLVSNSRAKERFLTYFFGGMPVDVFADWCNHFCAEKLPSLLRSDAIAKIQHHRNSGHEIVVVSASAENWIGEWCESNQLGCIATQLTTEQNVITGKLKGENCNGPEKVNRIRKLYNLDDYTEIYCYGDSTGDQPMLQLATHPFFRVFKQ